MRATPRLLARGGTVALGAVLGVVLGCPLELQRGLSCGDGWWDPEFEECDPRDPDAPYLDACHEQGFSKDATCDPQTCTIRASELECNQCGDGRAVGDEECDGQDLREQSCFGALRCNDQCRLDYSACGQVCGDGLVLGLEECEPKIIQGEFKSNACSDYMSTAGGIQKPYVDGTVGPCNKDTCTFGRNGCSFCGDGELDSQYIDYIGPEGTYTFPAEICDGAEVQAAVLEDHCEARCVDDPINGDVVLHCDFECASDCKGIALPDDVVPDQDPAADSCCVAKGSPCPTSGIEGVPDLPCCAWLENSATQGICVEKMTDMDSSLICP
jgi:hypothetical protein